MFDLEFVRGPLHDAALIFMTIVYITRVYWFTRFPAGKERQAPTGAADTTPRRGFLYSWANIAMPWEMESTRKHLLMYAQFVLFHVGVTAAIILMFSISFYFKGDPLPAELALFFQVTIGLAFLIGVYRIIRRFADKHVRAISTPDDHFSLWLLTSWFGLGFLTAPNVVADSQWQSMAFFLMGSFFLVYVPFSKISHYLYYPFTRYYLGKSLGRRGVFPLRKTR